MMLRHEWVELSKLEEIKLKGKIKVLMLFGTVLVF